MSAKDDYRRHAIENAIDSTYLMTHHEAAHAVLLYLAGATIERVNVTEDEWGMHGGVEMELPTRFERVALDVACAALGGLYAGWRASTDAPMPPVSFESFVSETDSPYSDNDRLNALEMLELAAELPYVPFSTVEECYAVAVELVESRLRAHWPEIERVASDLMYFDFDLDGEQVVEIIKSVADEREKQQELNCGRE